jgi:alanine dehydrogenase
MPATSKKITIMTQSLLQTQEQLMPVEQKKGGLYIGIPKETTLQENRVALVPSSVKTLTLRGHTRRLALKLCIVLKKYMRLM